MNKNHPLPLFALASVIFMALFAPLASIAANFDITPAAGVPFPRTIAPGQTVSAFYIVTNMTSGTRTGYTVQGLPAVVTQNTTGPSSCGASITLTSHAICTLQLDITKPVQSSFAICKGASCTTAAVPLNVRTGSIPPVNRVNGYFNATSCTGSGADAVCTAVGADVADEFERAPPLFAQSTDGGVSWSVVSIPGITTNGSFQDTSCTGTGASAICTAVGEDRDTNAPLLAQSTNGGASWSVVAIPGITTEGFLNGTSCTGTGASAICTAVGKDSDTNAPLLVQSTNGGTSWSVIAVPGIPGNSFFNSASCTGSGINAVCIAVGKDGSPDEPLLAQSTNGGTSWSVTSVPGIPIGVFNGASCSGSGATAICIAVGQDTNTNAPLLAQSTNGGTSWSVTLVPGAPSMGVFKGASCSGSGATAICIAVGQDTNTNAPLLAQSTNGGTSWSVTLVPGAPSMGVFKGASCSGSGATAICTAAGEDNSLSIRIPLLAQSTNDGASWSLVSDLRTNPNCDSFFSDTSCTGSGSNAICTAAGQTCSFALLAESTNGGGSWSLIFT